MDRAQSDKQRKRVRTFTQEGVRKLRPEPPKQVIWFDTTLKGLALRVSPQGSKSWIFLYYPPKSNTRTHPLGSFPDVGVAEARKRAIEFKANLPTFLENRNKPAPVSKETFKQVAEQFLKREVEGKLLSERNITRMLKNAVYPIWEDRVFEEIRRGDVTKLLDSIADTRGLRSADMALAYIRRIAQWYQTRNDGYTSPVIKGMSRSKPSTRKRKRILTDPEIRAMWAGCETIHTFGNLNRFLLLTAQRRSKVSTMKFDDIKGDVWTIATAEREKGTGERLKLPAMALDIIEAQRKVQRNDYIFPAAGVGRRTGPGKHFGSYVSFGAGKKELDKNMSASLPDVPNWTLHDLRRTAKSLMSRANVRPDISERVLGHVMQGIESVYDHHSYDDQRASALVALADLIATILTPRTGNVIGIRKKR